MVKYIATCCTIIDPKALIRINRIGDEPGYRKCRKHGGRVICVEITCTKCNLSHVVEVSQVRRGLCPSCEQEIVEAKKMKREAAAKKRVLREQERIKHAEAVRGRRLARENKKNLEADIKKHRWRGEYCSGWDGCKIMKDIHCTGCETFIGILRGHDPSKIAC